MFKIEPTVLYSLDDLERELGGCMSARSFLDSARPVKRFKAAWWGQDLIDAVAGKTPLNEPTQRPAMTLPRRGARHGNIPLPISEKRS